jgi:hypothetical protein
VNKLKFTIIFSVLLLICGFSTTLHANPEERFEVSVKAGYDDTIRIYSKCPIYIEIENKGKDFRGEIQVHLIVGYSEKENYALPFEIPEGSKKEFLMSIPIFTASKDLEIKIVEDNKVLFSKKHQFKKIIPPESPVMGILTNEANELGSLKDIRLSEKIAAEQNGFLMPKVPPKGTAFDGVKRSTEIIELDENNLPENEGLLKTVDFIIISDYDTSVLTEAQKTAVSDWVSQGNILVIGTGENARKVYSGLDESLKPFKINGQKRIQMPEDFANFTERTVLEEEMYISTGNVENGDIIIGDEDTPLAVNYKYGNGNIIVLAFDPTTRPISNWDYSKDMWERLLEYNRQADSVHSNNYTYGYPRYLNNIFEEETFPFTFLYIIILVYILLVGPVLYWILKHKDKRDYSWLIIPLFAFLFVGIIYMGGYNTRYKSAVINNYSVIRLDAESEKVNINSFFTIYNNKRGTLKIEYPSEYNFEIYTNRYYADNYYSQDLIYNVVSKISFGEQETHEIYNKPLWDSVEARADVFKEYEEKILFQDLLIKDDKIFVKLVNNTSVELEDCYVIVDGLYVSIGNINPKSEKDLKIDLSDKSIKNNFELLMNEIYPMTHSGSYYNDEYKKQQKKREAHNIAHYNFIQGISNNNALTGKQIIFAALNYDDFGNELKVNGKSPKVYNTNVIYTIENIRYEKGEYVVFPKGAIKPVLNNPEKFSLEDYMMYTFYENVEARLTFNIQRGITVKEFEIDWTEINQELFYANESVENKLNNYDLYIKNNATDEWEKTDKVFKVSTNVENYINQLNQIKVKADITFTEYNYGHDILIIPEIEVSGVVN